MTKLCCKCGITNHIWLVEAFFLNVNDLFIFDGFIPSCRFSFYTVLHKFSFKCSFSKMRNFIFDSMRQNFTWPINTNIFFLSLWQFQRNIINVNVFEEIDDSHADNHTNNLNYETKPQQIRSVNKKLGLWKNMTRSLFPWFQPVSRNIISAHRSKLCVIRESSHQTREWIAKGKILLVCEIQELYHIVVNRRFYIKEIPTRHHYYQNSYKFWFLSTKHKL